MNGPSLPVEFLLKAEIVIVQKIGRITNGVQGCRELGMTLTVGPMTDPIMRRISRALSNLSVEDRTVIYSNLTAKSAIPITTTIPHTSPTIRVATKPSLYSEF